jgi:hypothetical protein
MKKIFSVLTLSLLLTNLSFAQQSEEQDEKIKQSVSEIVKECKADCVSYKACSQKVKAELRSRFGDASLLEKSLIVAGAINPIGFLASGALLAADATAIAAEKLGLPLPNLCDKK